MTLKEITLLSVEEYQKYRSIIPLVEDWWWLRSPGTVLDNATFVYHDGRVNVRGYAVDNRNLAVRPALLINLEITDNQFWYKPEKLIGTKVKYGKYSWTILDAEFGKIYILCDNIITKRCFDSWLNKWDKSDLKGWLETEGLNLITN